MIWSEVGLILFLALIMLHAAVKMASPTNKMWLVNPGWETDGRKFIILAPTEKDADQIFMRHVCGWDRVFKEERSHARYKEIKADGSNVIVIQ